VVDQVCHDEGGVERNVTVKQSLRVMWKRNEGRLILHLDRLGRWSDSRVKPREGSGARSPYDYAVKLIR